MNNRALLLLLSVGVMSGCAQHYTITLNTGGQITTHGKPRLDHGYYYYKDAQGRKAFVPSGRVREIAPTSMAKEENAPLKARPVK